MITGNDKDTLIRNLLRNRVVLFAGAGFSRQAKNDAGHDLPLSRDLSEALWSYMYGTEYDKRTDLKTLYEAAKTNRRGMGALRDFMRRQLHPTTYPDWYLRLPKWYWYRIYTTNADDLIEMVYGARGYPTLDCIVAPDHFKDRDAFLRRIQLIKLNGSIADDSKELTFGFREYASRAANVPDVWYQHFVQDYSTLPTIFIGTELDEQLFWQYLELRGKHNVREHAARQPKSFLVCPEISKPKEEVLAQFNVVAIRTTGEAFLEWLDAQVEAPSRENVLRSVDPTLEPALIASEGGQPREIVGAMEYFYRLFKAPPRLERPRHRSVFLLGGPPTWEDIAANIDADRDINDVLKTELRSALREATTDLIILSSAAGGGKSTIAKRVCSDLMGEGFSVFFSEGDSRPDPVRIAAFIAMRPERLLIVFDHAGHDLLLITKLYEQVAHLPQRPVILVVARSNELAFRGYYFATIPKRREIQAPHLSDGDIVRIIDTLDRNGLLGELRKMTLTERIEVFRHKARKQILVALKEATSGKGFDDIMRDEFAAVEPATARLLYLVDAIASADNYGLTVQQMITAMSLPPADTLALVQQSLAGILVEREGERGSFVVRHPAIAEFILGQASREVLAEAYIAFLRTISAVLPYGFERRWSRAFRVYRSQVNHRRLHALFATRSDLVEHIYESIKQYYSEDGHYWLQYGSYELEYGSAIDAAENYINQAAAIMPRNPQVITATAHLSLKKAVASETLAVADKLMTDAVTVLRAQMADSYGDVHPYHIFGSQMMSYIGRWIPGDERSEAFRNVHDELRKSIPGHLQGHPELRQLLSDLKRAELETAVRHR